MKKNDIMDKVLALLELADSIPDEEESKGAVLLANTMMDKYNLSITNVSNEVTPEQKLGVESVNFPTNACPWRNDLAAAIAPDFQCVVHIKGNKIQFIGGADDAKRATYILEYLYAQGHGMAISYSMKNKKSYNAWVAGFVAGTKGAVGLDEAYRTRADMTKV